MAFLETIAGKIAPQAFARIEAADKRAQRAEGIALDALETLNLRRELAMQGLGPLQESFADYERGELADGEYIRINQAFRKMFQRRFLDILINQGRWRFVKDPIIRRGTLIQSFYAFAKDVEIQVEQDPEANEIIREFRELNPNVLSVAGLANQENQMQSDGMWYCALFRNPDSTVKLRVIDPLEITDIQTDPEDMDTRRYYLRQWSQEIADAHGVKNSTTFKAWYPDIEYNPAEGHPDKNTDGIEIKKTPVLCDKINAPLGSLWGIPEHFSAFDWSKAYDSFMKSWLSKEEAATKILWDVATKGGQKSVDAAQARIASSLSTGRDETNPQPPGGSAIVHGTDTTITAIKTSGSSTSPDQARRSLHMAIANMAPETFFGDASVGTVATAQSLDRPTELKFLFCQERWKPILRRLCTYALNAGKTNMELKSTTKKIVRVSFPDILEHDIAAQIDAMVAAFTLKGDSMAGTVDIRTMSSMFLHAFGIKNPSTIIDAMYPPDQYLATDWAAMTPEQKSAQAADMQQRADALSLQTQPGSKESFGAALLAQSAARLIEALPKPNAAQA